MATVTSISSSVTRGRPNRLYINEDGKLAEAKPDIFTDPYEDLNQTLWRGGIWMATVTSISSPGTLGPNRLYINEDGKLTEAKPDVFTDPYEDLTNSVAWGDVDGDGDLDLFIGNVGNQFVGMAFTNLGRPRLYINEDGKLTEAKPDIFTDPDQRENTSSVAWGDVDGDGDLDLFAGNIGPQPTLHQPGAG